MDCPSCHQETKVIDSRVDDRSVRRRRECTGCNSRFTTYERIELSASVTKRDGHSEPYAGAKLLDGIRRAGKNRPVVLEQAEAIVGRIEHQLMELGESELTTRAIGELVMAELKTLDPVAYLRFTSVCRSFENVDSFARELEALGQSPLLAKADRTET
jgi:transcriptional repressor NrdR